MSNPFSLDDLETLTAAQKDVSAVVEENLNKPKACEYETDVYRIHAPAYLEAGLPVIPLRECDKRPVFDGWSNYGFKPISANERRYWLKPSKYKNNMGLVTGKVAGICIMDIDTTDPEILKAIEGILPPSPWKRIGQKGYALAYKYNNIRSFRIQSNIIGGILDFLSDDQAGAGCQIVLPPSIHPKTMKPYVSNVELLSVLDQLTELPRDIEDRLRGAIEALGHDLSMKGYGKITDTLPAGVRDSKLTERAGLLAFSVRRGETSVKEAIQILYALNDNFVQQIEGDLMDMDKHISNFISFLLNDVRTNKRPLPLGWDRDLDEAQKHKLGLNLDRDQVEKTYDEIMADFHQNLEKGVAVVEAIRSALNSMVDKVTIDDLQEKAMLRNLAESSQKDFSMTDLQRYLRENRTVAQKEVVASNGEKQLLESHSAVAFAALDRLSLLYPANSDPIRNDGTGAIYKWAGSYWERFERDKLEEYITRGFQNLDITKRRSDIRGVTDQFVLICPRDLKRDMRVGVNFANGYLTDGGVLLPHHPDFGCTYVLPYSYRPDLADKMPMFKQYLYSCWGHEGEEEFILKVRALQQAICCSLMGFATRFQRAFLLYGRANTGKSVLLRIIASLFCEDAKSAISPDQWKENFQLVGMTHKLINIVGEISEKHRIEGSVFKEIVDGSPISVRRLYGEPFIFHCRAAQWAASNFLPKTSDTSEGFNRRWLIFKFTRVVPPNEVVPDLENKIVSMEREAIVAWAMDCLTDLTTAKQLTEPKSHTAVMRDLRSYNNPLRLFLQESADLHYHHGARISERDLYQSYLMFLADTHSGRNRLSLNDFRERLDEIGDSLDIPHLKNEGIKPRIARVESFYYGLQLSTSVLTIHEESPLLPMKA